MPGLPLSPSEDCDAGIADDSSRRFVRANAESGHLTIPDSVVAALALGVEITNPAGTAESLEIPMQGLCNGKASCRLARPES
jgi:hypothetical protein